MKDQVSVSVIVASPAELLEQRVLMEIIERSEAKSELVLGGGWGRDGGDCRLEGGQSS